MTRWSLPALLAGLHSEVENELAKARGLMGHPVCKGDATESIWKSLFDNYLPERYRAEKGTVVDSNGHFSDQIDIVVFDRQYSPLVFKMHGQLVIPAEAVYAVFEAKQAINAETIKYAKNKARSVRSLVRTSLPIPSAGGLLSPKEPAHILGGILALESDWKSGLNETAIAHLHTHDASEVLDLGCVASFGNFYRTVDGGFDIKTGNRPATAFLLEFMAQLQEMATVPRLDIRAYASWLAESAD